MSSQSSQSALRGKQGFSRGKGPPKLLLSSDSSSSDDLRAKDDGQIQELLKAGKKAVSKAGPPPVPVDTPFVASPPGTHKKDHPPKTALASEDPLLSVDSHPDGVQRIKSAVIARASSTKAATKADNSRNASLEIQRKESKQFSRSASKAMTSKPGAPTAAPAPADIPVKPKEKAPALEKSKPSQPPKGKGQLLAATPAPTKDSFSKPTNPASRESSSDDVWELNRNRDAAPVLKEAINKDPISREQNEKKTANGKVSPAGVVAAGESKASSKQAPKSSNMRATEEIETMPSWLYAKSESPTEHKLPKRIPSSGADGYVPSPAKTPVRDTEGNLAKVSKRTTELEAVLKETINRHKEELEQQRRQQQVDLAEEISKSKSELNAALEKSQREAEARAREEERFEEYKREALARQNSMKMRHAASVKELKEQIALLEKQNKARAEDFEKEKHLLRKSFDDKRKSDLDALVRKAQAHQEELRKKQSELLEEQGRVQALTTSVNTLTTSLAQMKELNDISHTATQALEEKAKAQASYIDTLMKREENIRLHLAKMMPIKEAKRLAFRALLKGRAVEMICRACTSTGASVLDKAWAFQQFVYLIGGARGANEKRRDAIEARLMQFRKEQMFLMAENERLMAKVAELQQEGVNQRQSKAALQEQALIGDNSSVTSRATYYNTANEDKEPNIRWLVVSAQLIINKRLLWAFFKLQKATTEAESSTTIDKLQKKFNELRVSAFKEMVAKIGSYRLAAYIRGLRLRLLFSAFFSFSRNSLSETSSHMLADRGRRLRDEPMKQSKQITASQDPFSKENKVPEILPGTYSSPDKEWLDLNVPLAHQPHYYRQLPSVRNPVRGRNVFLPMVEPRPPLQGYLPHPGYSNPHLTLGVPPIVSKGRLAGTSLGVPNIFPSGPYDATQPVDERGAIFRMRGAQQDLRKIMMSEGMDKGGARIVGKKLPNTSLC